MLQEQVYRRVNIEYPLQFLMAERSTRLHQCCLWSLMFQLNLTIPKQVNLERGQYRNQMRLR